VAKRAETDALCRFVFGSPGAETPAVHVLLECDMFALLVRAVAQSSGGRVPSTADASIARLIHLLYTAHLCQVPAVCCTRMGVPRSQACASEEAVWIFVTHRGSGIAGGIGHIDAHACTHPRMRPRTHSRAHTSTCWQALVHSVVPSDVADATVPSLRSPDETTALGTLLQHALDCQRAMHSSASQRPGLAAHANLCEKLDQCAPLAVCLSPAPLSTGYHSVPIEHSKAARSAIPLCPPIDSQSIARICRLPLHYSLSKHSRLGHVVALANELAHSGSARAPCAHVGACPWA
jgi:hypothetical protein